MIMGNFLQYFTWISFQKYLFRRSTVDCKHHGKLCMWAQSMNEFNKKRPVMKCIGLAVRYVSTPLGLNNYTCELLANIWLSMHSRGTYSWWTRCKAIASNLLVTRSFLCIRPLMISPSQVQTCWPVLNISFCFCFVFFPDTFSWQRTGKGSLTDI